MSSLSPTDSNRYCVKCKQKNPPIDTILEVGVNITEYRWNHGNYVCNDCNREIQRQYRTGEKGKYAKYWQQKHEEIIEELTNEWNDPAYKKLREIADRVYKVWNKAGRRNPEYGIRKDWICEVVFEDLWYIDTNGILEDYFNKWGKPRSIQNLARPYLEDFIRTYRDMLENGFREKAKNRWTGIVDAIKRKYAGRDKMVAYPPHLDPYTREYIDNWYLLSREKERSDRERRRDALKIRMDSVNDEERKLVERLEGIERREKAKEHREDTKDSESEEGGDNQ